MYLLVAQGKAGKVEMAVAVRARGLASWIQDVTCTAVVKVQGSWRFWSLGSQKPLSPEP